MEGEKILVTVHITLSTIRDYLKDHWKKLAAGIIIGFALVGIVFTLPLVTITSETTQTEYAIEIRQESYVVDEPYTTIEFIEKGKVIATGFYKVIPSGVVIPFSIDKIDSSLVGYFDNTIPGTFTVLTDINRIFWETKGSRGTLNLPLPPGEYQARFREDVMWGEDCYLYLAIKWTDAEQITRYRQVVEHREVPIRVEKQRTLITEDRISVWEYLFSARQS